MGYVICYVSVSCLWHHKTFENAPLVRFTGVDIMVFEYGLKDAYCFFISKKGVMNFTFLITSYDYLVFSIIGYLYIVYIHK